ncbi:site-2 protease family protein [Brevibacterium otitidis]|uniref:Site-2 protease family protein n=1 Tax=Brevibacterium otitidis TaxID=53364 RepID=A0ABV5WYF5_9MICO|nr:hypothetical protein GCM10023233_13050 [Brevibacterium otitidis]
MTQASTSSGPSTKQTGASNGLIIGRVFGAPVVLAWSWFVAAIIITVLFAPWVSNVRPDLGIASWAVAFAYAVFLFASVFLHEFAHAVAGTAVGQRVAAIELNIWGGFTRFEPKIEEDPKRAASTSFIISIVGPIINLALAGIGWLAMSAFEQSSVGWLLLIAVTFANAALGIINLLPGIPLDGGWAIQALIWRGTRSQYLGTLIAAWIGRIIAAGFVFWALIPPLLRGERPDLVTVLWMSAIAFMLWFSAGDSVTHAKRARRMETYDLRAVIQPAIAATHDSSIEQTLSFADSLNMGPTVIIVVLNERGLPYGFLDRHAASQVPIGAQQQETIAAYARPFGGWIGVPEDITAPHLLESLTHRPKASYCMVMRGSTLTGVIDLQEFFDELLAD